MLIGYARVSTLDQVAGFEAQLRELTTAGCERIFRTLTHIKANRERLIQKKTIKAARVSWPARVVG
jgi:DNA invertase Pin-like site-specific DNA recombinase